MLKILDRYIIKKFLGTFIFSILLLLAIVVMFDVNEKLDKFLDAPLSATVFDYFVNFLPYFANQFAPLFTFITVIFFTSKLAGNSEIIAMLAAGMSFNRMLRPYMISALIIAVGSFLLASYIIPPANVKRIEYSDKYIKPRIVNTGTNIILRVDTNKLVGMSSYANGRGNTFRLDSFSNMELASRIEAPEVEYDFANANYWTLHSWRKRIFKNGREEVVTGPDTLMRINFNPEDFLIGPSSHEVMTTPALARYIDGQKDRGVANIQAFEVEYHRRYAMVGAAFILTLIGVSLSSKKSKGGIGLNIGIGLALSFSYILFMTVTSTFAVSGLASPLVAMWIPNILYSIIALVLYLKARD